MNPRIKQYFTNLKPKQAELAPMEKVPVVSSLQLKYALSNFCILAIVLILLNTFPMEVTKELLFRSKETALKSQTAVISSALIELEVLTNQTVTRVIDLLEVGGLTRLVITDPTGQIVYDSNRLDQNSTGDYLLTQELVLALEGNNVMASEYHADRVYSVIVSPIVYRDNTIGAIYAEEVDYEQGVLLQSLQDNLRTISWLATAVAAILWGVTFTLLSQRIRALLAAIRIVGEGEYGHRLIPKGRDEMAFLAQEFNTLTDRLQSTEEVRRRFISDASHELRTPLASIQLLADSILQNDHMSQEMIQEFVGDIGDEAERLTRITQRLLTLSKLDNLPPPTGEKVAVNAVIERVIQNLELLADEQGVTFHFAPRSHYSINCTQDKFHQICYNLFENSIKYSFFGGDTTISLYQDGQEIIMEVADTGIGIPESELSKVFNRFYRVDGARSREAGGTGLGLAIVRDTARSYGGWVNVRQNNPTGTVFTVGLKAVEEEQDEP